MSGEQRKTILWSVIEDRFFGWGIGLFVLYSLMAWKEPVFIRGWGEPIFASVQAAVLFLSGLLLAISGRKAWEFYKEVKGGGKSNDNK